MKEIHVFDLDGTLVDSSHRYKTLIDSNGGEKIDLDYWRKNSDKVFLDEPLPLVEKFKELLKKPETLVVIATARVWCELSQKFLEHHNLMPHALIARMSEHDNRKGTDLKIEGLKKINVKDAEYHIYEDNLDYLKGLMKEFNAIGHYCPSKQGH